MKNKYKHKEYGDFQTPYKLATTALSVLEATNFRPACIIEPTCGKGSFLLAAAALFPEAHLLGMDISTQYLVALQSSINQMSLEQRTELMQGNFFELDWAGIINDIEEPVLITGNPPWVTSSNLGTIQSNNLPQKSNFQKQKGYDAITGKSNFDISEWMLIKYLDWMKNKRGAIAILCKFSVAKKVLLYAHKNGISLSGSNIYLFDAKRYFDVSVEACFFITHFQPNITSYECNVYTSLDSINPISIITCKNGLLISDNTKYTKWQHLFNPNNVYQWRSGIKHDCSKIMELERMGNEYKNTLNEVVSLEETYLYPLLKSSDISNGKPRYGSKFVIVTQEIGRAHV